MRRQRTACATCFVSFLTTSALFGFLSIAPQAKPLFQAALQRGCVGVPPPLGEAAGSSSLAQAVTPVIVLLTGLAATGGFFADTNTYSPNAATFNRTPHWACCPSRGVIPDSGKNLLGTIVLNAAHLMRDRAAALYLAPVVHQHPSRIST